MLIGFVNTIFVVGGTPATERVQYCYDSTLKRGLDQPCTNWSRAEVTPLMIPK